jgi:hypothetical protein
MLDRSLDVIDSNEITDRERLVERDGNRREDVAQNPLGSECHRDSADTKAGEKRRDIESQVFQR